MGRSAARAAPRTAVGGTPGPRTRIAAPADRRGGARSAVVVAAVRSRSQRLAAQLVERFLGQATVGRGQVRLQPAEHDHYPHRPEARRPDDGLDVASPPSTIT